MRFVFVSLLSQRDLVLVTSGNGGIRRQNGDGSFIKKTVGFLPEEASKAGLKTVCTRCKRLEGTQEAREVGVDAGGQNKAP